MLKLTLEDLAAEVAILKQRLDAIAPVPPLAPVAEMLLAEKKSALTPKMIDFLRRVKEERERLGIAPGPTLAETCPDMFAGVLDLPPDASAQVDHYLYGTPKR